VSSITQARNGSTQHKSNPRSPQPRVVWRMVAFLITIGLVLGLAWQPTATQAAPGISGRLCKDVYGLGSQPARKGLPSQADLDALGDLSLEYAPATEGLRNIELPYDDPREMLKVYGTNYKKYPLGSEKHLFARWNAYLRKNPGADFDQYLASFLGIHDNNARGNAFEKLLATELGLAGDDWYCQVRIGTGKGASRVDFLYRPTGEGIEAKAGSGYTPDQLQRYRANIDAGRMKGLIQVNGQAPDTATTNALQRTKLGSGVVRSTPIVTNRVGTTGPAPFAADPGQRSNSIAEDLANQAGRNQAQARQAASIFRQAGGEPEFGFQRPGGIDWSTLQLRYLSDGGGHDQQGVSYAFDAQRSPDPDQPSYGGPQAIDLSSDAFFTWLALPDNDFWVNLNPDTPDKIIDHTFAKTDAGRVLLEADMLLKQSHVDALNPEKTESGKDFWTAMKPNSQGDLCWPTFRVWISPKPAVVRQSGDELYILQAPLKVSAQRMEVHNMPGPDCSKDTPESILAYNFAMYQKYVVPAMEQQVNTAPQYNDLRRVYMARVAAAWIKARDRQHPAQYHKIINSGHVGRWPARTPWNPDDVYQSYLKDLRTVKYTFTWPGVHDGQPVTYTYRIFGGVDFGRMPRHPIGAAKFKREHPKLPQTTHLASVDLVNYNQPDPTLMDAPVPAADSRELLFLGGQPARRAAPSPSPTPSPTASPTASPTGRPTAQPPTTSAKPAPRPTPKPLPKPTRTAKPTKPHRTNPGPTQTPRPKPSSTTHAAGDGDTHTPAPQAPSTGAPYDPHGPGGLAATGGPGLMVGLIGLACMLAGAGVLVARKAR
jgi:hypothetical protein